MDSAKDMPMLQDVPPPGGFAPVRYARRIPVLAPWPFSLAAFATFSYGMCQVRQVRQENKVEAKVIRFVSLGLLSAIFLVMSHVFVETIRWKRLGLCVSLR